MVGDSNHTEIERVQPKLMRHGKRTRKRNVEVKIPHFSAQEGSLVPRLLCVGREGPGNEANMKETLVKGEQLTDN